MYNLYSKIANWLSGYPETGLDFYYQQTINYTYHSSESVTRTSVKWYAKERAKGAAYRLTVGSVYHKMLLPVIDADSEHNMVLASMWLRENKVRHSIIVSGDSGYWIILDRPAKKWKHIREWMLSVPGQDKNYIEFSNHQKMCYVRAEMKDDFFVPRIVEQSGSDLVDGFCNDLVEHYKSDLVRWLYRHKSYKDGKFDLTNPNECDVGITFDDVLA